MNSHNTGADHFNVNSEIRVIHLAVLPYKALSLGLKTALDSFFSSFPFHSNQKLWMDGDNSP